LIFSWKQLPSCPRKQEDEKMSFPVSALLGCMWLCLVLILPDFRLQVSYKKAELESISDFRFLKIHLFICAYIVWADFRFLRICIYI
jgi:hypothetical protein